MAARSFEDVAFGEELPDARPDVGMARVKRFTTTARMTFGRFLDHEEARREGLPGAIVPGIMSQAVLVAIIHRWAPGCEVVKIDTVFRAPIPVDSQPVFRGVVTDVDAESGTVELDLVIANEADETRVMGTAKVKL